MLRRPLTDRLWTPTHRKAVIAILFGLVLLLAYRSLTRPTFVPDPLPAQGSRAAELPQGLDPNTAPWEQLSLLPGLGESKAKAIVDFRTQFQSDHPGEAAFKTLDDLMQIKGIGPATVENLSPYLRLPE